MRNSMYRKNLCLLLCMYRWRKVQDGNFQQSQTADSERHKAALGCVVHHPGSQPTTGGSKFGVAVPSKVKSYPPVLGKSWRQPLITCCFVLCHRYAWTALDSSVAVYAKACYLFAWSWANKALGLGFSSPMLQIFWQLQQSLNCFLSYGCSGHIPQCFRPFLLSQYFKNKSLGKLDLWD